MSRDHQLWARSREPGDLHVFHRWPLSPGQSIAPLIQCDRRGIYVLEFANGEFYVGQSVDVVTRFATHVHGSSHHEPWADIIALRFRPIPHGNLDAAERSEIHRLRSAGHTLRNKAGNLGHKQPAPLDAVVSIEQQHHWATGAPNYDLGRLHERIAAGQPLYRPQVSMISAHPSDNSATTKLAAFFAQPSHQQGLWQDLHSAIIRDLGFLLKNVIPNAVDTELNFWTLSDMPSTSGGRFASLNTGVLELAYFPRRPFPAADPLVIGSDVIQPTFWVHLNFPEGTLLPVFAQTCEVDCSELSEGEEILFSSDATTHPTTPALHWFISKTNYRVAPRDTLSLPVGSVKQFFTVGFAELLPLLRTGAISLMRQGSSGIFRRFHSPSLVTSVFNSLTR